MAGALCSPTHQVGHIESTCTTDPHDDTTTFTVPSDCDCLVLCISSYRATWSAVPINAPTWDDDGTPQTMTAAVTIVSANTFAGIYYLLNPTTGQKTLNVDWNAQGTPEETVGLSLVYLKNIDGTGTIVATDSTYVTSGNATTSVAGTNDQDIAISAVYNYDTTPAGFTDGTSLFVTALTASGTCGEANAAGVAYDTTGSPFTFSYTTGTNETAMVTALFKGTVAGGNDIPIFQNYYRQQD